MAKDNKKLVQAITSQEENFAQWYTDICVKAELVEYSSVKGFIILRPYGQAIWELIQKDMDARFKATGHENVAMPVLIPESLLQKEGELVNGFAPEVAWVTMGGSDKLEERLAVRPTSETMFCDHWSRVLHSYRELPMKYNQWCSVVRWEKTTRPFLRSREFWWQEGHTIHETAAEAEAETQQQLNCYADVCEQDLAIPVVKGRKTDKEKFAGAEATYTIEAMMKDGKALQSGTSHYFGDKFSKAYDVTFTGRDNQLHHPFQTSWGVSTRLVGAIIMTHGDDDGLILPPAIAPIQVVVVPIAAHKPGVSEKAAELAVAAAKKGKAGELPQEQVERLDALGMDWTNRNDRKWMSLYDVAAAYYHEHGNLNVPSEYVTPDGVLLGKWVVRQRYAYLNPDRSSARVTPERKALLDKLGMVWEKYDPWQERYDLALAYKTEHGDLEIPSVYKTTDGVWLGSWVSLSLIHISEPTRP